jgi:hypothetical protein
VQSAAGAEKQREMIKKYFGKKWPKFWQKMAKILAILTKHDASFRSRIT